MKINTDKILKKSIKFELLTKQSQNIIDEPGNDYKKEDREASSIIESAVEAYYDKDPLKADEIYSYIKKTYLKNKRNFSKDILEAIKKDQKVISFLGPFIAQSEDWLKNRDYYAENTIGDRDMRDFYEEQERNEYIKDRDQSLKDKRERTKRPLSSNDVINYITLNQVQIENIIKYLSNKELKGNITIKVVVMPDNSLNYMVSNFNGTGMNDNMKYKITNGLHSLDKGFIADLRDKMYKYNLYINEPVTYTLWQGII